MTLPGGRCLPRRRRQRRTQAKQTDPNPRLDRPERLLEAFAGGADAPAWPLVLRGDRVEEAFAPTVARLGLGDRVRFLPRLDPADMPTLYSAAGGLAFASLFEGGGIPVVEAMA